MSLPRVSVVYADGNLQPDIAELDGLAGLIVSGEATDAVALNEPFLVNNLEELEDLNILEGPVTAVAATGEFTLTDIGAVGDEFTVVLVDDEGNETLISEVYERVLADSTAALLAAKLVTAMDGHPANYGASNVSAVISLEAPTSVGGGVNGFAIKVKINDTLGDTDGEMSGGVAASDNGHVWRQVQEFYQELGGNQALWVMLVADTATMASVLLNTNANGARKLLLSGAGNIGLLGIARIPDNGHAPGSNFIDAEMSAALTAANGLGTYQLGILAPVRTLVGARVANEASSTVLDVQALDLPYAGAVLGSSADDNVPAVGLTLGRAVKYGAEIKVGKVANGPLSISEAFIGTDNIKDIPGLATLHGKGYISFCNHPGKGGVYFGIDRMATPGDFRILAHGRVIDKACRVAAATYANQLEGEVTIDAAGAISDSDLAYLKAEIDQAINVAMGDQISGLEVVINPAQNLINNPTLQVGLNVRPKGYTSFINVTLGLVA